jgi:hypothetical protein
MGRGAGFVAPAQRPGGMGGRRHETDRFRGANGCRLSDNDPVAMNSTDDGETRRLLSRAIHEALEAYVTPTVCQTLLRGALEYSGLTKPPVTVQEAERFLRLGLLPVSANALGAEMAESIVEEIERAVARVTEEHARASLRHPTTAPPASGRRAPMREPRRRSDAPTMPPARRSLTPRPSAAPRSNIRRNPRALDTGPAVTPGEYFREIARDDQLWVDSKPLHVFVATTDSLLLRALASAVGTAGEVRSVRSIFALVRTLEETPDGRVFVLLDGANPAVRPEALAALAEDLTDVTVVLCRTSADTERRLAQISPATLDWIRLNTHADSRQLAADCARLVS